VSESAQIQTERRWHDPAFVARWHAQREKKFDPLDSFWRDPRFSRNEDGVLDGGRSEDLRRERKALSRQVRDRKPGDPSRALPLAFDAAGHFVEPLRGKIGARNATQSRLLLEQGLTGKARRQAWCGLIARRRDCFSGHPEHKFYAPCLCGNRYCAVCGPKSFRDLFGKHSRLSVTVERLLQHRPGDHRPRVLAKLDITTVNVGAMPSAEEVRQFNEDVRRFFREAEKRFGISRKDYGFLWCCEFGSGNTNLHAHGVYVGPELPQRNRELSALWKEIRGDGSCIVSIKHAKSFEAALGHALKYPSKFFDADPARLVELEVAFHRVRRVHALAAFYNPKIEREPGEDESARSAGGRCPICGDVLLDAPGYHFIDELQREGRREMGVVHLERMRARVLSGAGPP
jgi:hypothetical protein